MSYINTGLYPNTFHVLLDSCFHLFYLCCSRFTRCSCFEDGRSPIFPSHVEKQMRLARREGVPPRLPRNNLISLLPRRRRFRPPGIIKTPGSFLRLMPADMAISSAPALTGEKCQVSPRRRDRGVNDILSNYLSPLHRPGVGT